MNMATPGEGFLIVGTGFVMFGVAFLMLALRDRARIRRTLPARGVVIHVRTEDGGRLVPVVRYRTSDGEPVTAACAQGRHGASSDDYQRGQAVDLRYDPEHPSWAIVEGRTDPSPAFVVASLVTIAVGSTALALQVTPMR